MKYIIIIIHFEYWFNNIVVLNFQDRIRDPNREARIVYDDPWHWIVLENKSVKNQQPLLGGVFGRKICLDLKPINTTETQTNAEMEKLIEENQQLRARWFEHENGYVETINYLQHRINLLQDDVMCLQNENSLLREVEHELDELDELNTYNYEENINLDDYELLSVD